ncbi:hypothetical protein ACKUB1_11855 [Methanospirillum stamsii]|uniref:AbrB family transcriptional regulator n=1 Tax=Methanospirillum stamsii TaxID=1277351 RepID=A0A2V2N083_9EURY|nr:hypothetical protein [Methanospirillum stamsii]PWR73129.1 hypothetical protein DLD82_11150 [Methanospirillum stamsii]
METVISEDKDLIVPREIWREADFSPGDHVMISVVDGKIVIIPEKNTIVAKFKALAEKVQINDYQSDEQYDLELQERLDL